MIRYTFIFMFFLVFNSCQTLPDSNEEQPSAEQSMYYLKNYNFTTDFFTRRIPAWNKVLGPFKGKPNINYLEIGVFEGRSGIWMLENILTHPTSRLTGIDIFPNDLKKRYLANLDISGFAHKATTIDGYSQVELRKLPLNSFDIIYIDACHRADCTLSDAVLSFELLKDGGILIFDDYKWLEHYFPEEKRPQVAIDSFITTYRNYIEVVHHAYQVVLKKRKVPSYYCESLKPFPPGCSPIGQYVYVWEWNKTRSKLYTQDMSEQIKLSAEERRLIERLIKSTKFGKTELYLDCTLLKDKDFLQLIERLKLDLTKMVVVEGDACECEGDFDCDGDVDETDAALFKADFGRNQYKNPCTNNNPCNGDFNCDGDVDWSDAERFKEDYGKRSSKDQCPPCVKRPYCLYQ